MKINIFLVTVVVFTFCSCGKKENYTVLSGRIPDSRNSTLKLIAIENYFPGLESKPTLATAETDSLGNFLFRSDQIKPGFYQVIRNNNYHVLKYDIYLEAGDSIHIQQSSWDEKPKLLISGRGSDKLDYLMSDYQVFPNDRVFDKVINSNRFKTELLFKQFINSLQYARFAQLSSNNSTPENLKSHFKKVITAEMASILLRHLERRNYIMSEKFDYFYPDPSYFSFMTQLNFDPEFCNSTAARLFAGDFLTKKARASFKDKNYSVWWTENLAWKQNFIELQAKSPWTDFLAMSTIKDYSFGLMETTFFDDLKTFNEKMKTLFFIENDRLLFENNVADYFALAPGMVAPNIELPDSTGKIIRLSDFKGKVVYIDFWGTWCSPCIEEIPDALELQKKYNDQPVVFLYVALEYNDKNIDDWKTFIAGKNMQFAKFLNKPFPGIHVVAEKQFLNENIRPYKINFAPTHVLVDQNGKLVNARAGRSKDIMAQIDQLLGKVTIKQPGN